MGSAARGGEKGSAPQGAIASQGRVNNAHPIEEHVKTIAKVLDRMKLSEQEKRAWELVVQATQQDRKADASVRRQGEIDELRGDVKALTKAVGRLTSENRAQGNPQSWAQMVQGQPCAAVPISARREKEIMVAGAQAPGEQGKTATEVAQELGSEAETGIRGVRRLPSGMYALSFADVTARNKWATEGKDKIAEVLGAKARIREHTLDVIVSGFPGGSISRLTEEQLVEALSQSNPGVGPTVRKAIVKKTSPMRSTESAILGFASPRDANQAIDSGVTWGSYHLSAEPFTRGVRAERCFKCQEYCGHIARHCRKQTRCGWCAQYGHSIETCPTRSDRASKACGPCGGERGHSAIDQGCPGRIRAEVRAKAVYNSRPMRFQSSPAPMGARRASFEFNQTVREATPRRDAEQEDNEGYVLVGKAKRRRGRPTALSLVDTTKMADLMTLMNKNPPVTFPLGGSQKENSQEAIPATQVTAATDSEGDVRMAIAQQIHD